MMITTLTQLVALGLGLVAGALWPRDPAARLPSRASALNLANGALLFALRVAMTSFAPILTVNGLHGVVPLASIGPVPLQFVVAFLALDFTRWALHLAHHRVEFLWTFHRVHHCVETMDATAGFRMHLIDFAQLAAVPVLLFGVLFETDGSPTWLLPAVLSVGIVADAIAHANVRFPLDTAWRRAWYAVFMTPLFHAWHHTRDGHVRDGNYGNALPWWDRLFGTDVSAEDPPPLLGVRAEKTLEESLPGFWLLRPRSGPR